MRLDRISLFFIFLGVFVAALAMSASARESGYDYGVVKKVEWAKTDLPSLTLTMDIYTPVTDKASYPVLVIYHGGGWLINNNTIMDSMAVYMVRHAGMVVCNVNYRLLGDRANTITMNQIIEDALGAIAWIRENIAAYQGDPQKIIVTGDSAGGHLAAMVLLCSDKLESDGFKGATLGFTPTWLPPGKSAEEVAASHGLAVQGAILSYAAFDIHAACLAGMETSGNIFWLLAGKPARRLFGTDITVYQNPEWYKAVSPIYSVPLASQNQLPPQLCLVGSDDTTIPPAAVQAYVETVRQAGQPVEYWEYPGKPHAFLDSRPNTWLGTEFTRDAPTALARMIQFLRQNDLIAGSEEQIDSGGPYTFGLEQNYPNPFNDATLISYSTAAPGWVELVVYDAAGREIAIVVNGYQQAGQHTARLSAQGLPSGVYFSRLRTEAGRVQTRRMVMLR